MRFVQEWAGLLVIFGIGTLVALVTWLAATPHPASCHLIPVMSPRPRYTALVCR